MNNIDVSFMSLLGQVAGGRFTIFFDDRSKKCINRQSNSSVLGSVSAPHLGNGSLRQLALVPLRTERGKLAYSENFYMYNNDLDPFWN